MTNPFTAFAFPASGSNQVNRTMPARLADFSDVKNFGALGDGTGAALSTLYGSLAAAQAVYPFVTSLTQSIDWAAVTAAMNNNSVFLTTTATSSGSVLTFAGGVPATIVVGMGAYDFTTAGATGPAVLSKTATTVTLNSSLSVTSGDLIQFYSNSRGTIYFPPGNYVVSQPIDFSLGNLSAVFLGELGASTVTGNFADYVFKQTAAFSPNNVFDKLNVINTNATGGGIRIGGTQPGAVRNCTVTANQGISTFFLDTPSYDGSFDMSIENCTLSPGSNYSGSIGILLTACGPVINCSMIGYATGMITAANEENQNILGCYFEGCGVGFHPGQGPDGGASTSGFTMSGCWFKNNGIAIENTSSGLARITGCRIEGANGQAPGGLNCQYGIQDGSPPSNPSGLRHSLIAGVTVTGQYDVAGIAQWSNGSPVDTTYAGVQCTNSSLTGGAKVWSLNFVGANKYFPQFIACSGTGLPYISTVANLPAAQNIGDTYNVSDGTNGLAWGATVTNTGTHATHYKTRWNGSNYTVVGK